MNRVLIVSQSEDAAKLLYNLFKEYFGLSAFSAKNASDAMTYARNYALDLAVINTPVSDIPERELARKIIAVGDSAILVILRREEHSAEYIAHLEEQGIAVLDKPVTRAGFLGTVRVISVMRNRAYNILNENSGLREQLTEQKLVARAKCTLIQYLGLSEAAAHRHIEKQAMDLRMTKRQIAENILRTYEQ